MPRKPPRYGIWVISLASGRPTGTGWVKTYDPDAHGGQGGLDLTQAPAEALSFRTISNAMDFYREPSTVKPYRDDNKPNRPLTAYSVEIKALPREVW